MAPRVISKKSCASNHTDVVDAVRSSLRLFASAIASGQGSRQLILKRLYYLLIHLLSGNPVHWDSYDDALPDSKIESKQNEVDSFYGDLPCLSDILFRELDTSFEQCFVALGKHNQKPCIAYSEMQATVDEVALLLRCCFTMIILLKSCQEFAAEKGRALYSFLTRLISYQSTAGIQNCSFFIQGSLYRKDMSNDDVHATTVAESIISSINISKPPDPSRTFLCTMLEVFTDELLMTKFLRELFFIFDISLSSTERQIKHGPHSSYTNTVLEVVSAHFVLSFSDEKSTNMFHDRLFWLQGNEYSIQIGLNAATMLLLHPPIFSAPKMLQVHLVLLVSDAIGIGSSHCYKGFDDKLIESYLKVFERSVVLYTRHMCNLDKDGNMTRENTSVRKFRLSNGNSHVGFDSLVSPSMWGKVNHLITKFNSSWASYLNHVVRKEDTELLACSVSYAKEVLHVYDYSEETSSEILSFLSCILLTACSEETTNVVLDKYGEGSSQDVYLLASMLKLMSSSMFKVIRCLKYRRNLLSSRAAGDVPEAKKYHAMMNIISSFQHFCISLPVQRLLCDAMEAYPQRHKGSKWMLLHLSGIISLSYVNKLDFLMKDAIFAILTVLQLFVYEEGDLAALRSLFSSTSKASSISNVDREEAAASDKSVENRVNKKSSLVVASNFLKIRTLYLGKLPQNPVSESGSGTENTDSVVGVQEETCNGESFLRCLLKERYSKSSDVDDLADFIVCKPEKDYNNWLKGRQKFRKKWKSQKLSVCRWNQKKNACG